MTQNAFLEKIKAYREGYRAHWVYKEHSHDLMIVARYDSPKEKVFHQFFNHGGEWKEGMPLPPYPLFGLESLVYSSPIHALVICEGEKCAASLHQLGWPAMTTVLGATNLHHSDFTPLRHFKQFVILHDNDEAGYSYARGVATEIMRVSKEAEVFVCNLMPNLKHGDFIDWIQAHSLYGSGWDGFSHMPSESLETVEQGLLKAIVEKKVLATDCPKVAFKSDLAIFEGDPLPLKDKLHEVPPFPTHLLPEQIRNYLSICAKQFSSPVDFVSTSFLTFISGLIGRAVQLEMRPGHEWRESANVWSVLVGRPSAKKSPILRRVNRFVHHLEMGAAAEYKEAFNQYKKEAKKCQEEKREPDMDEPTLRRYTTNDCTSSKLRELLAANHRGLLLYSDELKGQLQKLDKHGNEGDRSFFMSCWSGLEYYNEDRIMRGSNIGIPLTLSWIGCIPPESLSVYLRQAMSDGYGADGLMQRFQMITYPDFNQPFSIYNEPMPDEVLIAIQELFCNIDSKTRTSSFSVMGFSSEAQKEFDRWHMELESECRSGEHPLYWESHLGKQPKLVAALCIILHIIKVITENAPDEKVSLDTLQEALGLVEYYRAHAKRCYGSIETDEVCMARKILELVKQKKLGNRFKSAEIYRNALGGLKDSTRVNNALSLLKELGYIIEERIHGQTGTPTRLWVIHPSLLK